MTKPLDAYDARDRLLDSKGCFDLAIAELRKEAVIAGRVKPITLGEIDLRCW